MEAQTISKTSSSSKLRKKVVEDTPENREHQDLELQADLESKIHKSKISAVAYNYEFNNQRAENLKLFLKKKIKRAYEREPIPKERAFFNIPFLPNAHMFTNVMSNAPIVQPVDKRRPQPVPSQAPSLEASRTNSKIKGDLDNAVSKYSEEKRLRDIKSLNIEQYEDVLPSADMNELRSLVERSKSDIKILSDIPNVILEMLKRNKASNGGSASLQVDLTK